MVGSVIGVAAVNAARRVGRRNVGRSILGLVECEVGWVTFPWVDGVLMRMMGSVKSGLVDAVFIFRTLYVYHFADVLKCQHCKVYVD